MLVVSTVLIISVHALKIFHALVSNRTTFPRSCSP